jgi:cation diffusion facilitator CzcD-associated flavoprotein CzcO
MTDPLQTLSAQAQAQLDALSYPKKQWVTPRDHDGTPVLDVAIIGAGQSGLTIALGLKRENVTNIRLYERSQPEKAGPWRSFARMKTLRTPKHVSGPEAGIPALTPESWYRAKFGDATWESLGKIPRAQWQDYLIWLRKTIDPPVLNGVEVMDLEPLPTGITAIHYRDLASGDVRIDYARAVVLAPGIEATGAWAVPDMITTALPRSLFSHTADDIDFAALKGKKVAVLGGGASAFDNAAEALEAGAQVDLFVRRPALPPINPYRWMEFTGFLRHFPDLSDGLKWKFMQKIFRMNQPPPQDTYDRCAKWPSFTIHYNSPFTDLRHAGGRIDFTTPKGQFEADFLIVGTGMVVDFTARPELRRMAADIATWADRFDPAKSDDYGLGQYPYLGDAFQFRGLTEAADAVLSRHYCYTFSAMVSQGCSAGISALKFGSERVVRGITRQLFTDDAESYLASLHAYDELELRPEAAPTPAPEKIHETSD